MTEASSEIAQGLMGAGALGVIALGVLFVAALFIPWRKVKRWFK